MTATTLHRVADMVREMFVTRRRSTMTPTEMDLAIHLRGNQLLYDALTTLIQSRITGRASLPVPERLDDCAAILHRDNELRWLLGRLEFIYHAPVNEVDNGVELPA